MKTYKYKTMRGLLMQAENNMLTLDNIISNRLILKKRGWCAFELEEDETKKAAFLMAEIICKSNPAKYANYINNAFKTFGIYTRISVSLRNGHIKADYCAGQDYSGEIKTLQNLLKKYSYDNL